MKKLLCLTAAAVLTALAICGCNKNDFSKTPNSLSGTTWECVFESNTLIMDFVSETTVTAYVNNNSGDDATYKYKKPNVTFYDEGEVVATAVVNADTMAYTVGVQTITFKRTK